MEETHSLNKRRNESLTSGLSGSSSRHRVHGRNWSVRIASLFQVLCPPRSVPASLISQASEASRDRGLRVAETRFLQAFNGPYSRLLRDEEEGGECLSHVWPCNITPTECSHPAETASTVGIPSSLPCSEGLCFHGHPGRVMPTRMGRGRGGREEYSGMLTSFL